MTDMLDIAQWAKHWEALARQAQSKFGASAPPSWFAGQSGTAPWTDSMGKANPFASASQQSGAIEHLLGAGQGYLGMLQSLATAASDPAAQDPAGFSSALRNGFFPGALPGSPMNNPLAAAMSGFGGNGAQGFEQMMERFTAAAGPMFDSAKGALHMPAFGHLREKQENLQKTMLVFIDYQEQNARYDRLMLKVSEKSFARFQLKLAEREEPGRQIDSVRGLYDLWIDAAEEAYAEIALSEEFREVYAAVVNAQMRVRQQVQGQIEKSCGELGMPTRSEIDSIGERLQALRREVREDREKAVDLADLGAEVAALRNELKALKASKAPAAKAKVSERAPPEAKSEPKDTLASVKTQSMAVQKSAPARRVKSTKSALKRLRRVAGKKAEKSSGKKLKSASGGSSFAASIARFARKSKSTAVAKPEKKHKSKADKRGGDR